MSSSVRTPDEMLADGGYVDHKDIAEWRARMATEDAKQIYKDRAATAESINADLKCFRGLDRFLVRTLPKVACVVF